MTTEAGRGRVLAHNPIGPVAPAETFKAPATGRCEFHRILVHDADHLSITLSDGVAIMLGLEQIEDDYGSIGKSTFSVTFHGFVVAIEMMNAAESAIQRVTILDHREGGGQKGAQTRTAPQTSRTGADGGDDDSPGWQYPEMGAGMPMGPDCHHG